MGRQNGFGVTGKGERGYDTVGVSTNVGLMLKQLTCCARM